MSTRLVTGEAPDWISEHKIKLAIAIRTKNAHWKMKDIHPGTGSNWASAMARPAALANRWMP